jgi:molybdate transport system ATP-binding protein
VLNIILKKAWDKFILDVAFKVIPGRITVLFGPSGAGKSTILRIISGLEIADEGEISIGTEVWLNRKKGVCLPPNRRSVGFVFQDYALFPHMTVEKNVAYGIRERERLNEVKDLLSLVGLADYANCYPGQLSGGQKQRVALIRALARKPDLLLMDEPLSAVDWQTRRQLQEDLKRIINQFRVTTLYVTHDVTEAYKLADYVVVLGDGRVVKQGIPEEVFMGKRLSTRLQLAGKVVNIESDPIMAAVTVLHADQYFSTLIDTEEVDRMNLKIGDDVIIGAKSSDVILFKATVSI